MATPSPRTAKQVYWQRRKRNESLSDEKGGRSLSLSNDWAAQVPADSVVFQVLKRKKLRVSPRLVAVSAANACILIVGEKGAAKSIAVSRVTRMDQENAKVHFSQTISMASSREKEYAWPLDVYFSLATVGRGATITPRTFIFRTKDERRSFVETIQSLNQHGQIPSTNVTTSTRSQLASGPAQTTDSDACVEKTNDESSIGAQGGSLFSPNLLHQEEVVLQEERVSQMSVKSDGSWSPSYGTLWVTNYRLFFSFYTPPAGISYETLGRVLLKDDGAYFGFTSVPLWAIHEIKIEFPSAVIFTKDHRRLVFAFDKSTAWLEHFRRNVLSWGKNVFTRFSIVHRLSPATIRDGVQQSNETESGLPDTSEQKTDLHECETTPTGEAPGEHAPVEEAYDGWQACYDPTKEFEVFVASMRRAHKTHHDPLVGIRLLDQKISYSICKSYPRYLVVPSEFDDRSIQKAAQHRSSGRFPAIRWVHSGNGSILARSSQPMAGVVNHRSALDEQLLEIFSRSSRSKKLYIIDARGRPAVIGNTLKGKGVEKSKCYQNATIELCQIGNIHTMRSSLAAFVAALEDPNDQKFWDKVHASSWLSHICAILTASVRVAEILEKLESSVLVHCSDGFDRTPQLICVAKILLDPQYRTLDGFCTLIESEWCAFGHKFEDRYKDRGSNEFSPIFLQFLDTMNSLLVFRSAFFEFNEDLLLFLAEHLYSARFGTFLFNNENDRLTRGAMNKTVSIWTAVQLQRERFINKDYVKYSRPIWPSTSVSAIVLWRRYWFRENPHLSSLCESFPTEEVTCQHVRTSTVSSHQQQS